MEPERFEISYPAYLKIPKTNLRIRKVTNIQTHTSSCMFMSLGANQQISLCMHTSTRKAGGRRGEGKEEKISAARAAPRRPSGRNLRLKARAPEQYDHREYCSGALAFNRKYPYRADSAKKVDLQSGTVRDSPGHQLS